MPPELIALAFLALTALPAYVTYRALKRRGRLQPWKVAVAFLTGWLGAVIFLAFDK